MFDKLSLYALIFKLSRCWLSEKKLSPAQLSTGAVLDCFHCRVDGFSVFPVRLCYCVSVGRVGLEKLSPPNSSFAT